MYSHAPAMHSRADENQPRGAEPRQHQAGHRRDGQADHCCRQHRPRRGDLRPHQPQRPRPHVVGAADAVGVVVGVVDADDHRDRDNHRQQRLPPARTVQPGGRAGAGDDRGDRVGQRPGPGTLHPLRETGHERQSCTVVAFVRESGTGTRGRLSTWRTDSVRRRSARTPCRRSSGRARRPSATWPRSSPPRSRTSRTPSAGFATDVFEIRDGARRASRAESDARTSAKATRGGVAALARSHRRQRVLYLLRVRRPQRQPGYSLRRAECPDHRRHRRSPRGGVPATAWRQPRILAAHRAVPRQHVGAARARCTTDLRTVRGRQPHAGPGSRCNGRARPIGRPHQRS